MPHKSTERRLTDDEIEKLTPRLTGFPRNFDELKEFLGQVVSLTFMFSLFMVIVWLLVNWVAGFVIDFDFGWSSAYGTAIFWSIVLVSFVYTVYEIQRCNKPSRKRIRALQADIESGTLTVEEHEIRAAKVFQEPEHLGLFYFLLTSEDRVYVAFDYESVELNENCENPLDSTFRPKSILRLGKTTHAQVPLIEEFVGDPIEVPEPLPMTHKGRRWPEPEEFVDTPWAEIESYYSTT